MIMNRWGQRPWTPRHNNGIAVFMDFVGAHFAKDEWGLVEYSGVAQYGYEGDLGEIPGWGIASTAWKNSSSTLLLQAGTVA